ncbi:amidohydrolase family protein [Pelagicoccus sp. SDUM812002]|uniref:amidohydrolase family protein n=1 Tax=Pelagicoccus sp. SDUM812002 TaxID=3041266 RepID=UPI00280EBFEE|nr:amidohydrolase family protein [Pelagicoccus sp. SDUM812002]MDQ8184897.1 amidohydrolase family protein [Pelagicoccus sp. SDUM812002]
MGLLFVLLSILGAVLLLRILLWKGPIGPVSERLPMGVVDMHCHTAGIGAGGSEARISEALRGSWRFRVYLRIFGTSEKNLMAGGDRSLMEDIDRAISDSEHVRSAVILAMDAPHKDDGSLDLEAIEVWVPNRFVGEVVKDFPNLLFAASVHPLRGDALEELEWSKANGAVLVKWLPNIQNIDPSDERLVPYYEKLVELDLPLLTHTGHEDSFSRTDNCLGDPKLLELPLRLGVRVIAAHVASAGKNEGQCNVERLLEMMPRFPNLVADISTLTQFNRKRFLPRVLADERLRGRLLYGTDYPLTNTPMVSPWLYPLRLTFGKMLRISRVKNPWDRDVKLKTALGVPVEVFEESGRYLLGSWN